MTRFWLTFGGLVFGLILFLAVNVISTQTLTTARLDLTEDRLYTLSDGSVNVLSGLEEDITLQFFYSERLAQEVPAINAQIEGDEIIQNHYYDVGVAVGTDKGLMVPVVKDADKKGIFELAKELAELAQKARDKKLAPADMQGGCFTISSLGHISSTGFTPIVNAPEVAIMGISRSRIQPVYIDGEFVPRMVMPYSISFDHRVIDGVAAAEFARELSHILSDIRDILL